MQFDIEGRRVLDLFAGTGQLGIECLSRGAASAVFVDRRPDAVKLIRENLELMCGVHGFSKQKTAEKVGMLCEQFGLRDVMSKRAGKLSGGWQRRLSIAMAIIGEPKILFLDEPTLGLDVIARSELWDVIRALKASTTVILTTHYMEEAEALSDRVGIMRGGRLLLTGTAEEIKSHAGTDSFEEAFIKFVKTSDVDGERS